MIRSLIKKIFKRVRKKEVLPIKLKKDIDNHDQKIKNGDLVKFSRYALEKQLFNETLYGKCDNNNCKCDRIFEESFVGLVVEANKYYADVLWPESVVCKVSIRDIELVNEENNERTSYYGN
jgi:hypothetical protein